MKSNITVQFLSAKEMEDAKKLDWRYDNVDKTNLGFADKMRNRIYVRAGLDKDLTKYLVDHEMEHLFELEGTDEDENGIRHKKSNVFGKILQFALPVLGSILLPGLGTGAGMLGGAALAGTGAVGGSLLGNTIATGKPDWLGSAISGAASGVGSAVGGGLGQLGTKTAPGGQIMTSAGPGVYGGGTNAAGQAMRYGTPMFGSALAGLGGQMAGQGTQTGLGILFGGAPSTKVGFNAPNFSGWDSGVPLPMNRPGFGLPGAAGGGSRGSTEQGFGEGIKNQGLGQVGIAQGGGTRNQQNVPIGGQQMGQGMNLDPKMISLQMSQPFNAMNRSVFNF